MYNTGTQIYIRVYTKGSRVFNRIMEAHAYAVENCGKSMASAEKEGWLHRRRLYFSVWQKRGET